MFSCSVKYIPTMQTFVIVEKDNRKENTRLNELVVTKSSFSQE